MMSNMIIFKRTIEEHIVSCLFKGKAILLFGPRQAGKTTLSKKLLEPFGDAGGYFNCELAAVRKHFVLGEPERLSELVAGKKIAVFDEAQTIEDIGAILKAFIDADTGVQVIATGSSSFDLANRINEPLTGRVFEFILYPLSLEEMRQALPDFALADLYECLRTGSYPGVVAARETALKEDVLKNLATNYLYKDVFTFESIRNPRVFEQLVKLLALQIGSLVSVNELSRELGIARATVEKYLRLLEQSYVIKVVRAFSRNPRNEIKKAFKVYFIDVGVRNAVIDNVAHIEARDDRGYIFENFFVIERTKQAAADPFGPGIFFWRNRKGAEVDVVEESQGAIIAYECKWGAGDASASLATFRKAYPNAETTITTPETVLHE